MTSIAPEITEMSSLVGQQLGRYVIGSKLGQGGMAEVYQAHDGKLGRDVAVKVILPHLAADTHFLDRFLREARAIAALEHPHILPVYDFGEQDGLHFLVMRFIPGGTLSDRLLGTPLPVELAVEWTNQLASALDAAHAAGVLHRDVKPGNVLVGHDDRLYLADFGLAKLAGGTTRLTQTGIVVGTPMYMAPEVASGRPAAAASDRYALAVMVYEMLAGQPPFSGENALSILNQHVTRPVPPLSERATHLPAGLDSAFEQGLAKDPGERPASCRALLDSLATHLSTGTRAALDSAASESTDLVPTMELPSPPPVVAGTATSVVSLERPSRRWIWAGLAGAVLALAGIFLLPGLGSSPELPPAREESVEPPAAETLGTETLETLTAESPPEVPPPALPAPLPDRPPPDLPQPAEETTPGPSPSAQRPFGDQAFHGEGLRDGTRRPTERDFRAALERAGRLQRGERRPPTAAAIERYCRGGLALLAGDTGAAAAILAELADDERFLHAWGPSVFTLLNRPRRESALADWEIALGYGDPLATAGAAIDRRLTDRPDDAALRFGRVLVHRIDGEHQAVIEGAAPVYREIGGRHAELASYAAQTIADAHAALGRIEEAFGWYGRAYEAGGAHRGAVAFRAGLLAREHGRRDEVRRFLRLACEAGLRVACRMMQGGDARPKRPG